ncbi:hypothetical protein LQF56_11835, partial [Tetragenococcus halophilus]|nr:hypothetical protein [Tetragenococcus halophilus]
HKKAIIAICKMLLTAIWNVLSKVEPYDPTGYFVESQTSIRTSKVLTQTQALALLRSRGYVITDKTDAAN